MRRRSLPPSLVVARYAVARMLAGRRFRQAYILALAPPTVALAILYVLSSAPLIEQLGIRGPAAGDAALAVFRALFRWQAFAAFVLAALGGPEIVSPDLVDGGLPLLLARPLGRWGYVRGKVGGVMALLAPVTWGSGLLVWLLAAGLLSDGWWRGHLAVAGAILGGHILWTAELALLVLATSAWVRNRSAAQGLMLGILMVLTSVGAISAQVLHNELLTLVSPPMAVAALVAPALGSTRVPAGLGPAACLASATLVAICLAVLMARLRAAEVVR